MAEFHTKKLQGCRWPAICPGACALPAPTCSQLPEGSQGTGGLLSLSSPGSPSTGVWGLVGCAVQNEVHHCPHSPISGSWHQVTVVLGVSSFLVLLWRASLTPNHHSQWAACAGLTEPPGARPPCFWMRTCAGGQASPSWPGLLPSDPDSVRHSRRGCRRVLLGATWRDRRGSGGSGLQPDLSCDSSCTIRSWHH